MSKGIKITLIVAAVCVVLSFILLSIAFFMSGSSILSDFERSVETSIDGVNLIIDEEHFVVEGGKDGYSNFDESSEGVVTVSENINSVDIEWIAGNVEFVVGGEELTVHENAPGSIGEDELMGCWVENGTLKIKYDSSSGFHFGIDLSDKSKDLTVTVPEHLVPEIKRISVDTVSANVTLGGFALSSLEIDTTSGNITVSDTAANEADLSSVSGELKLELSELPRELDADTVSGDVEILLPEGADFELEFETVSGELTLEHPSVKRGDKYVVGDGAAEVNVSTISGNAYIKVK